jgi:putative Holliday junction resolvase
VDSGKDVNVRPGVRIGVDVGDVRIGLATSDREALIATPLETLTAGPEAAGTIVDVALDREAVEVVVGLPRSLSGHSGPAATKAESFARAIAAQFALRGRPVPVRLVDERLTTVSAERVLRESGRKGARRRSVVDQVAAVVILQHAIDSERSTGRPPGEEVGHST